MARREEHEVREKALAERHHEIKLDRETKLINLRSMT